MKQRSRIYLERRRLWKVRKMKHAVRHAADEVAAMSYAMESDYLDLEDMDIVLSEEEQAIQIIKLVELLESSSDDAAKSIAAHLMAVTNCLS